MSDEEEKQPDLGQCCACRKVGRSVRNVYSLGFKAPVPGTGWGCAACGLPSDGALAVICDACHDAQTPLKFVCNGFVAGKKRLVYAAAETTAFFGHDMTKHPGEEA